MDAARLVADARRRSGLTLRQLGERAGTSHATLAAYESERKIPRVDTLARILRCAGMAVEVDLAPRPDATDAERVAKGEELVAVLELAAAFPARHAARLTTPVPFGRGGSSTRSTARRPRPFGSAA